MRSFQCVFLVAVDRCSAGTRDGAFFLFVSGKMLSPILKPMYVIELKPSPPVGKVLAIQGLGEKMLARTDEQRSSQRFPGQGVERCGRPLLCLFSWRCVRRQR